MYFVKEDQKRINKFCLHFAKSFKKWGFFIEKREEGAMKREYGLSLWTFGEIPFEEKCRLAKEVGADGVEVQGDIRQNPKELAAILAKHQLKFTYKQQNGEGEKFS